MKREDKLTRADINFIEDLNNVKIKRINNNLEKKMISNTELTRMARNSPVYPKLMQDLETKPRRKKHA